MRKTIKLAVVAALALGATSAFATNGDHLIGMGAKARGMGGVGIGMSHGAESGLANPALITSVKDTEISFGGTIFMPNVKTELMGSGTSNSAANMSMIPEVSIASKVNDNFYFGIGMWGTAGMGVDYRDESGMTSNMNMVTNLQLMQFGVPLAYTTNGFSVGITPIMQYGALDINYDSTGLPGGGVQGAGVAQDFGYGYNLGLSYEISGLTIGAVYKSEIEMEYTGQLSGATQFFTGFGFNGGQPLDDKLTQPAEIGLGASYAFGESTIALDYKQIKWADAAGYKDFGWKNQSVYALGYEYATANWAARVGYNYGENPIDEQDGTTMDGSIYNMFNLLGFPATVESHFTIGGTYNVNDKTSIDLAYAYAPEVSDTFSTAQLAGFGMSEITTKHSQTSLSFQLNYAF